MYVPLVPCPSCSRHVRIEERSCPFCAGALPDDFASRAAPPSAARSHRRAALAFAAAVAAFGPGCGAAVGDETSSVGAPADASSDSDAAGVDASPLYGLYLDAADAGDAPDEGSTVVMYGIYPDAPVEPDAADAADTPDEGSSGVKYGIFMDASDADDEQPG